MIVLEDQCSDRTRWDGFVERNPEGRFSHLYGYGEVLNCYGYRTHRISFIKGNDIVALISMTMTHSMLFGRKLISQPFSEYGGLLVAPELEPNEITHIVELLQAYIARNIGDVVLEIHGNHGIPSALSEELFVSRNPHSLAYLELKSGADDIWTRKMSYEARKAVNKARNSGLTVQEECNESAISGPFFSLYLKSMKRLGAPPHTLQYYRGCYQAFQTRMKIFWATMDSVKIAGLLGFECGNRVSIINIVSEPSLWHLRPNDFVHWEFIRYAAQNGYSCFDFGSVRYDGQERFKKKWGCTFVPNRHYFLVTDKQSTVVRTFDSSSSSMTQLSNLWSSWMPGPLATRLGPTIRRQLAR